MTTGIVRSRPYIDLENPDQIRIHEPSSDFARGYSFGVFVGTDLSTGKEVAPAEFDFEKKTLVVDLAVLKQHKIEKTLTIIKKYAFTRERICYDVEHLFGTSVKIEKLRESVALFRSDSWKKSLERNLVQAHMLKKDRYWTVLQRIQELSPTIVVKKNLDKVVDFSSLYEAEHNDLAPRLHRITAIVANNEEPTEQKSEDSSLEAQRIDSVIVHGSVIAINGGLLKTAFTSGMLEQQEKELQVQTSDLAIVHKFVQYLYKMPIEITNDREARELNQLAEMWEIQPLQELCGERMSAIRLNEGRAMGKRFLCDVDFALLLDKMEVPEMISTAEKASEEIQRCFELYIEPLCKRMNV